MFFKVSSLVANKSYVLFFFFSSRNRRSQRTEIEIVGISSKGNDTVLLCASVEELVVPASVWTGDIDEVVAALPLKLSVEMEGNVVCLLDCPVFSEV